jgi:SAM-dependent methyltransferase
MNPLEYTSKPLLQLSLNTRKIESFLGKEESNIDWKTVESFGQEWNKFHDFSEKEINKIGDDYFDIVGPEHIKKSTMALDVGCGSGRWAKYLSPNVGFIEAIDPSNAVFAASSLLEKEKNIRITQAGVDSIPFQDNSFDFVYSLGVLHHLPNTKLAISRCFEKLKPKGWFLIYLYYNLDNRGIFYRLIFNFSNLLRVVISQLSETPKKVICDLIAAIIYWPLARFSFLIGKVTSGFSKKLPLSYYGDLSFKIMRNDSLDRFGTPLEKRFSKDEIEKMLTDVGFVNIKFSEKAPYWHAISQKP